MIVLFISQCEKKAKSKTRQVLDMYADRIGSNTWKTNITKEGLLVVKQHLSKSASKNTAVSCHWIHKSKNTELLWIVGSRSKFTSEGIVPIATTTRNLVHNEWETKDIYLPIIKSIVALAALFHDVGKASNAFQQMLNNNKKSDVIRHEYISMLIFQLFTKGKDDKIWLEEFSSKNFSKVLKNISKQLKNKLLDVNEKRKNQTPLQSVISYLIVSHHKKPYLTKNNNADEFLGEDFDEINYLNIYIDYNWGYIKNENETYRNIFSSGLPFTSKWLKEVQKWSSRLLTQLELFEIVKSQNLLHLIIAKSRLYLMLGDYYFSSKEKDNKYKLESKLFANTTRETGEKKQYLEEHLLGVEKEALNVIYTIRRSILDFPVLSEIKVLKRPSPKDSKFYWQDRVSKKLRNISEDGKKDSGFFCVNLASTGTGKTFANAKIINSIFPNDEDLRFSVALGLRSLTLQTGDMYRNKMHIDNTELAVVIGSSAIEKLHNLNTDDTYSQESFFDEIDYDNIIPENALNNVIKNDKDKKFLCAPVCVSTIDHLMPATESIIGGHWIVPFIRLFTSDLIIDEIDDFIKLDLIAIARLVHLAGILGRRVIISSATITESIAEGFYKAYASGWEIHNNYYNKNNNIITCFVDEYSYSITNNPFSSKDISYKPFKDNYRIFINKRIKAIKEQEELFGVKRKGQILEFDKTSSFENLSTLIIENIYNMHIKNHVIDKQSNKQVSIGLIRFSYIKNCIKFANILKDNDSKDVDIFFICYHSQNILLIRNEIENYLDNVLYRKNQNNDIVDFTDNNIRSHIDNSSKKNIVFLVISTPIEEVGRDHDFDWAIVEPSSIRSIIQLSGRVIRHRNKTVKTTNVLILEYNLQSLNNDTVPVFKNPGYEDNNNNRLNSHDLKQIVDINSISESINSVPRLKEVPNQSCKTLIDIEHNSIKSYLLNNETAGPENLNGYYNNFWYLTGLPQIFAPFRVNVKSEKIYIIYDYEEEIFKFYRKLDDYNKQEISNLYKISFVETSVNNSWIELNYENLIHKYMEKMNISLTKVVDMFCYVDIPCSIFNGKIELEYSEIFGLNRR